MAVGWLLLGTQIPNLPKEMLLIVQIAYQKLVQTPNVSVNFNLKTVPFSLTIYKLIDMKRYAATEKRREESLNQYYD